eukprot:TRINITY_DN3155_c0_g1_i1.p2 TRINITY_DN3155_c0_g1~~TRINITY_DN3155_c0_g1_i1.p2  ORF type:complete len:463 (+),score=89.02 TRINITY_DN3155_c0_g1_i1:192-1580(+)
MATRLGIWLDRFPKLPFACANFTLLLLPILTLQPVSPLIVERAVAGDSSKAALYLGIIAGLDHLTSFFVTPILGILSDKYGRKPFIFLSVISAAIEVAGFLVVFYVPSVWWLLFVTAFLSGLLNSVWGMSFSYAADISHPHNRARYFGILGAAAGIAVVVGPLVGGLAGYYSYAIPVIVALSVACLNALFTIFILPESRPKSERPIEWKKDNTFSSLWLLSKNKLVFVLCIAFCLNQITQFGTISTSILYDKNVFGWDPLLIGLKMAEFGLILMIVQGFFVKYFVKYLGEKKTILTGLLLVALVQVLTASMNLGWYQYLIIPFKSVGSVAMPLMQAIISRQFGQDEQGKIMNLLGALQTLMGFVGPMLFSGLYSYFTSDRAPSYSPEVVFYVSAGVEVLAVLFAAFALHYYYVEEQQTAHECREADKKELIEVAIELNTSEEMPDVVPEENRSASPSFKTAS